MRFEFRVKKADIRPQLSTLRRCWWLWRGRLP